MLGRLNLIKCKICRLLNEEAIVDLPKNIFEVEGKFDDELVKEGKDNNYIPDHEKHKSLGSWMFWKLFGRKAATQDEWQLTMDMGTTCCRRSH